MGRDRGEFSLVVNQLRSFVERRVKTPSDDRPVAIAAGDLNGDGEIDVAVAAGDDVATIASTAAAGRKARACGVE